MWAELGCRVEQTLETVQYAQSYQFHVIYKYNLFIANA